MDTITGSNVYDVVPRALAKCMERPFGAAYLTLSAREALTQVQGSTFKVQGSEFKVPSSEFKVRSSAAAAAVALSAALAGATRPLVVIGLGINPANAARIRRWVSEWNLPVAVTWGHSLARDHAEPAERREVIWLSMISNWP